MTRFRVPGGAGLSSVSRRQRRWLAWIGLGALVALGLLTAAVAARAAVVTSPDAAVTRTALPVVQDHPAIRDLVHAVTVLGDPSTVSVVCLVWVLVAAWRRKWPVVIAVIAARLVSLGITQLLKTAVDRPRPHVAHPVEHASGASFPSGHATGTATVAVLAILLVWHARRWRWPVSFGLALVMVAVAASRVMLGVHYLSDVVAGTFLGVAVATGTVLAGRIRRRS